MKTVDMIGTGKNIRRLRKEKHKTVSSIQDFFDFGTPQSVYKWESGLSMPTIDHLVGLAEFFGVTLDDIVEKKEV